MSTTRLGRVESRDEWRWDVGAGDGAHGRDPLNERVGIAVRHELLRNAATSAGEP